MNDRLPPTPQPALQIVSRHGSPDVAEIFVARTRPDDDESMIEFVDGLDWNHPRREKWIINVSTQFGCPMGCVFCDAAHRYHGNLATEEMLAQVKTVIDRHPGVAASCSKLKIHFARMGEPALNDNVLDAMQSLPGMTGAPGLWACVATTAPRGTERWFERLLDIRDRRFPGRFQLQFSLNSTDQACRAAMTRASMQPFGWIREYAGAFHRPGERRVVLNFAMAKSIPFDAYELRRGFDPETTCVKLTPLNPTGAGRSGGLESLTRPELDAAADAAVAMGFETILSVGDPREDDIGSNCGQSVRRHGPATRGDESHSPADLVPCMGESLSPAHPALS